MRRFPWIGFAVLLVFDTSAQVCFKYAALAAGPERTVMIGLRAASSVETRLPSPFST